MSDPDDLPDDRLSDGAESDDAQLADAGSAFARPSAADREPALVGASAGSARAAARASATTPGKGRATPRRDRTQHKGNIFSRIVRYLREVASELRKVIWPTRNEMTTYSIVVIVFLIFMIAITWGADFGFARLILWIFG